MRDCGDGKKMCIIVEAVNEVRKSDNGKWLEDGAEGRQKRRELMRLLDKLYGLANA